jgi:hypothetical protein
MCLSPRYRLWMRILLPTTLGVGTLLLSLAWPRAIELETVTLRGRRRIRGRARDHRHKLRCEYRDWHITRIDVHHPRGRSRIPVNALHRQVIAAIILQVSKGLVARDPAHLALPIPGASRQPVPLDIRV